MLIELRVENFGIMEEVRFRPEQGFNALTGETGSGKSLILQALDCVLGARAGGGLVRNGASRAVVEAIFDISPMGESGLPELMLELGIPAEGPYLNIRREISPEGRGRVTVNSESLKLAELRRLTGLLVEMHGQHDHQRLLEPETHLDYLDLFAGTSALAARVSSLHGRAMEIRRKLRSVQMEEHEKQRRLDFLRFAIDEIDTFGPREEEYDQLEQEKAMVQNSGKLYQDFYMGYSLLKEEDPSVLNSIEKLESILEKHAPIHPDIEANVQYLRDALYSLEAVADFLRSEKDRMQFSPERLEDVEERLSGYRKLHKKYGGNTSTVLSALEDFLAELSSIEMSEEQTELLKSELKVVDAELLETSEDLSIKRRSVIRALENKLAEELSHLGMPGATIQVTVNREMKEKTDGQRRQRVIPEGQNEKYVISEKGLDRVELYFCANRGEQLQPLRKVASGGELSRIMLALKTTVMEQNPVPTVIFDEIDTGVGGEVACAIGDRLQMLAGHSQLLVVTHLHQIASLADRHFRISKALKDGRTFSRLDKLQGDHRMQEMARMLGGGKDSMALEHARHLLNRAGA
ncbi:MAG: DNA repair protein RecN [Spirochaetaceae bacterium]|nr:DNA repair protein RecN [Spirochaetaceae bacterium]|tara:strand:+ start:20005 stop:21738 length:1734 start_codon:yes stop_codon:yes gene_type:complete